MSARLPIDPLLPDAGISGARKIVVLEPRRIAPARSATAYASSSGAGGGFADDASPDRPA